jgi:ATP-dependent DNA helicase DinG
VDPFSTYQLPTAAIWLKQGFGRLIRGRRDRGVIAILDRRLLTHRYGRFFRDSLPPAPVTTSFFDVERFFGSQGEGLPPAETRDALTRTFPATRKWHES